MNTTQFAAATEHARWTFETFGMPSETQAVLVAKYFAQRNGLDGELTYMVMLEAWGKLSKRG